MNSFFIISLGFLFGRVPTAYAAITPCPIGGLTCLSGGGVVAYINNVIGTWGGSNGFVFAFVGLLVAMFIYYGFKLVVGSDNDSTVTEVYRAYGHAVVGTVLAMSSFTLAGVFAVPGGDAIVEAGGISVIGGVAAALKGLVLTALIFNISFQGIRLITSQDESQAEKAKKQFLFGLIGAAMVVLAEVVANAFTDRDIGIINDEALGISNFLGTVFGALAVVAILASGIFLVISVDEQYKERAKKILFSSLIILAIVISSLSLLKVFIFTDYLA